MLVLLLLLLVSGINLLSGCLHSPKVELLSFKILNMVLVSSDMMDKNFINIEYMLQVLCLQVVLLMTLMSIN